MRADKRKVKHIDDMTYEELANQGPESAMASSSGAMPLTEANLSAMNKSKDVWSDRSCTCPHKPVTATEEKNQGKMDLDMKKVNMIKATDRMLSMGWS